HPNDPQALRHYTERYAYDAVGNILQLTHQTQAASWSRTYAYTAPSLLEPERFSNRLSGTAVGATAVSYTYDAHGNITGMPHLPLMRWDVRDRLQAVAQQVRTDGGTPETTYYAYDATGRRVRKVTLRQAAAGATPTRRKERIDLGGFEVLREYAGDGTTLTLERQTLHVLDDAQPIALIETRTAGDDPAPARLIRYQLTDQLGSVGVELDQSARLISYEAYHPYGTTAYQAVGAATETPKRYRYTGMERDEESGFSYHSARYYAPWLGRWTKPDPVGIRDSINTYQYVTGNPIRLNDPSGLGFWGHVWGGLKTVGGAIETAAGATLVGVGTATSEVGIGIPIAAAGAFVTAHGVDTTVSGARQLVTGHQADTLTSTALQAAGMSKRSANLVDAGIGVVGTLGAGAAARAPSLIGVAAEGGGEAGPSITLAFKPALGPGHNMVGVTTAAGDTFWSHLVVDATRTSSGAVTGGDAFVIAAENGPSAAYTTVRVPVTAAQADAALSTANQAIAASSAAEAARAPLAYSLCGNSCSTYAADVMNAAGIATPPITTPLVNLGAAALRSPGVMTPLTAVGAGLQTTAALGNAAENSSSGPSNATSSVMGLDPNLPNPADYHSFDAFAAAAGTPYRTDYLMAQWALVHGWVSSD
ncbi:MAG TPA: RHS repeat-associated core domain-containing protein, partial [Limnochordia bacterium]|nr:RHS repeat-associated core domain-containing protein [Limnochordia bacterium]